jgi:hypothetical protein
VNTAFSHLLILLKTGDSGSLATKDDVDSSDTRKVKRLHYSRKQLLMLFLYRDFILDKGKKGKVVPVLN